MFQGPRAPFPGGMPPQPFMNPMQGRPPMPPPQMMRGMGPQMMRGAAPQMKRGGGLLAKLMGRGGNPTGGMSGIQAASRAAGTGGVQAASRAASSGGAGAGGLLKSLSNPTAINGFLTNTQKVLSTAQQFGPMVQQYGPLVKNIPSMWKLYKGLKNSSDEPKKGNSKKDSKEKPSSTKTKDSVKTKKKQVDIEPTEPQETRKEIKGQSIPKMYI
ncbi:YqfQ family protein [Bacillus sp. FJAT-29790]|uniref:YqfQ family protein n=1 Tax=Bacillus sp. FJAT-29790 TaxID=1895002 RepID=UPI001C24C707|nr:YqfQ family protein [Bacillus sp. FJAT-29790]MBU8879413.1 YqfQ family protein [Bacillus sp. FJAT-29790]